MPAKKIELSKVQQQYLAEFQITSVGINIQTDLLAGITFPSLPYNFRMLMEDLDWPAKAAKNPNGTLFWHPKEIDDNVGEDIGLQCFGNKPNAEQQTMTLNPDKNNKVGTGNTRGQRRRIQAAMPAEPVQPIQDSYIPSLHPNSMLQHLYEAYMFEDSSDMVGFDIDVKDLKSINTRFTTMSADVIKMITTYITRSLSVITKPIELVAGSGAREAIRKITKVVSSTNQIGVDDIKTWLKNNDSLEKSKSDTQATRELKAEVDASEWKYKALDVVGSASISDLASKNIPAAEFIQKMNHDLSTIRTKQHLNNFVKKYTELDDYGEFNSYVKNNTTRRGARVCDITAIVKGDALNESYVLRHINEDDNEDSPYGETNPHSAIDYDELYNKIYGIIVDAMNEVIGPRLEWVCMKGLEDQMKNLKDRADTEITKRIEIICKTNGQKSLVHWPLRAEGLLTMWNRYSSELQTRIKNRIDQLTGSAGGRDTGSADMVEDFLRNTYPRIIAAMVTYRLIYAHLSMAYKKGFSPKLTLDNMPVILNTMEVHTDISLMAVLRTYDLQNP